jgi:SNARE protein
MEIRLVQDINERRRLEGTLQTMDQELRTLKADLKALQAEENRGELFVSGGAGGGDGGEMDPTMAGSNMLSEAAALQDKTQDSLANTRNMIAASKEVGVSTLEELQRQREVINNIDKETDRLDDNLARAEALMKQFGKRMAGDKFIQCFAVINCCLLCGVVIWAIMKKGDILPNADEPANPVRRVLRGDW